VGFLWYLGRFIQMLKRATYKYKIQSNNGGIVIENADPLLLLWNHTICSLGSRLQMGWCQWMENRQDYNALDKPYSVYEVHLGSWKRHEEDNRFLTYLEFRFSCYVRNRIYARWIYAHHGIPLWSFVGYQLVVILHRPRFESTRIYGSVDRLHQAGIGVILDWVPSTSRWCARFRLRWSNLLNILIVKGYHPDWKSLVFNYGEMKYVLFNQ
jgi:1,4-alpha-glucan branching enzyme